jgi:hypothetical protein
MRLVQHLLMNMLIPRHNTCMWFNQPNFDKDPTDSSQLPLFDSVKMNQPVLQSTILSRRCLTSLQDMK